jgi:hypothetical protein
LSELHNEHPRSWDGRVVDTTRQRAMVLASAGMAAAAAGFFLVSSSSERGERTGKERRQIGRDRETTVTRSESDCWPATTNRQRFETTAMPKAHSHISRTSVVYEKTQQSMRRAERWSMTSDRPRPAQRREPPKQHLCARRCIVVCIPSETMVRC